MIIQKFEKLVKKHKRALNPFIFAETVEWTDEEIRQQENELNNHKETVEQKVPKAPKAHNRKKFISDLFCLHSKLVRKGDYIICTKCGYKWKANYNAGTSKRM